MRWPRSSAGSPRIPPSATTPSTPRWRWPTGCRRSPRCPGSKIFFTSGGSDSVDTAVKLARRYWRETGHADKNIVIGREKAYHGMHVAGTALAGIPGNHDGYGELMPDVRTVAWDTGKGLLELIEELGAERIAAFFCEPVIGAGGIYPPPAGYLAEVRQICRDNDILFVADEVITGFGRIGGDWFASTRFDLEPDIMTTAKGLTSGYVPMGAIFVAPRVAEPFFDPAAGVWWRHGYTYGGHAAAAAAAMANLDIIERENLLAAVGAAGVDPAREACRAGGPPRSCRGPQRHRGGCRRSAGRPCRRSRIWRKPCGLTGWRPGRSAPAASRSRRRS